MRGRALNACGRGAHLVCVGGLLLQVCESGLLIHVGGLLLEVCEGGLLIHVGGLLLEVDGLLL